MLGFREKTNSSIEERDERKPSRGSEMRRWMHQLGRKQTQRVKSKLGFRRSTIFREKSNELVFIVDLLCRHYWLLNREKG